MSTLREAAEQALEALEYGHFAVADQAPHADVMAYLEATDKLREALAQPEPEPWQTRERFYEAMACAVENVRQEMKVKTVTMRCKDYDVALPILDAYSGHVLVGPVFCWPRSKK